MGNFPGNDNHNGIHVAIIMDGSGRWAQRRGLPRSAGHRAGVDAVRRVVESTPDLGIEALTLYAFSSDNWRRPSEEVANLMQLLEEYLRTQVSTCVEKGVRLRVLGSRTRLSGPLRCAIEVAESATSNGTTLVLQIALDYSSRDAILQAAVHLARPRRTTPEQFARRLGGDGCAASDYRDVDLLIRTGGELRLSDFMLWECAYAELYFTPTMWPDFSPDDLAEAVQEYHRRDRRYGRIPDLQVAASH
ncbi:MAG: di-trans,poly-cis-decaprenylcistransferase [Candidatus Hydrogenedentes bacterium]|nr:di-trans,poly-cis-decaprenylcistransferase [Candidatus Hydrogenedentota bacterium]